MKQLFTLHRIPGRIPLRRFLLLPIEKLLLLLLPVLFISATAAGQQHENENRINACFSAHRTEIAENLCFFYNHLFRYTISYGAVDQYAVGYYRYSNDTVYLNSKAARAFTITAGNADAIPRGKIKLVFKHPGNNAGYIAWTAGDGVSQYADALKKSGNDYAVIIERPAGGSIELQHTMYEKIPAGYAIDKSKNQFSIAISDSLGALAFNNEAFVWEGNNLRSADPEKTAPFILSANAPLQYSSIPWNANETKPSQEIFEAWSRQQENLFQKRAAAALAAEAAKAQALKQEMLQHFAADWSTALQKARQDSSAIVLLMQVDNPDTTKNIAQEYYNSFTNYSYEDNSIKTPVFLLPVKTDTVQQLLRIELLPALAVIASDGNMLFKMEGTLPEAGKLRDYYSQLLKSRDKAAADSAIARFTAAPKDSAYLVKMIGVLESTKAASLPLYAEAGINVRNLLDTLVEKHVSRNGYQQPFYDFAARKYFPERWMSDYYSTENPHPLSPTLVYLVQHFGSRQKDLPQASRRSTDSLVMKIYLDLSAAISIAFYSAEKDTALYTRLLALNRQLISGYKPYMDFFSSIVYLEKAQGLSKFGMPPTAAYENDLAAFLTRYAGGSDVTADAADAEARKMYQRIQEDSNQVFLDTYFMNNATEAGYTRTYRTVIGHIISLQAVVTMTRNGDSILSRAVLQKPGVMKQLALAAELSTLPNHYPLKRNYAYALYEMGDTAKAIALLQEAIKIMENPDNSYLTGTDRIKQAKEMLQKMKTGKKLHAGIATLVTY